MCLNLSVRHDIRYPGQAAICSVTACWHADEHAIDSQCVLLHACALLVTHWEGPVKDTLKPYVTFHAALRSAHMGFVGKLEAQARTLLQVSVS